MTDIYKPPNSDLEDDAPLGAMPRLVYLVLLLFLLEAISVVVINLGGAYGIEPIEVFSEEMGIVVVAIAILLQLVWSMAKSGKKSFSSMVYIFLLISLVFDGQNWLSVGVFVGVTEALTLVNFVLLLVILYLVKVRLNKWFVR